MSSPCHPPFLLLFPMQATCIALCIRFRSSGSSLSAYRASIIIAAIVKKRLIESVSVNES